MTELREQIAPCGLHCGICPLLQALARWITGLINRQWERKNLTINEQDMLRLHERFWEENDRTSLVASASVWHGVTAELFRCLARTRGTRS